MTDHLQSVLSEIVAVAGDPALTLEQLQVSLTDLYNRTIIEDDQPAAEMVVAVWEQVNTLQMQAGQAINVAAAAKEAAIVAAEQRDIALHEYSELYEAVENEDVSFALVADLVDNVTQRVEEETFSEAYQQAADEVWDAIHEENYISTCPACDITREGADLPLVHDVAARFHEILTGSEGPIDDPLRQELADFIIQFVNKFDKVAAHEDD